jgi:predicted permease
VTTLGLLLYLTGWLGSLELRVFLLMPLLPIAANILVFTSRSHEENEFVGAALLASTILSCLFFFVVFSI